MIFTLILYLSHFTLGLTTCVGPSELVSKETSNGGCSWDYVRYGKLDDSAIAGVTSKMDIKVPLSGFAPSLVFNGFEHIVSKHESDSSVRCLQMQDNSNFDGGEKVLRGQEDCFSLNIRAPENSKDLPVVVFIHGGMYQVGAADDWAYEAKHLAVNGKLVVVVINYRVGVYGFLGLDERTYNNGVHDQRRALEWVKENIQSFGGNPNNIRIFGESAGATSVVIQALYDATTEVPIIKGAISQSNPLGISLYNAQEKKEMFEKVTYKDTRTSSGLLGDVMHPIQCIETDDISHCNGDKCSAYDSLYCTSVRISKSHEDHIHFMKRAGATTATWKVEAVHMITNLYGFGPTVDGNFIQEQPMKSMNKITIPFIQGTNREEGFYFPDIISEAVAGKNIGKVILFNTAYGGYNILSHPLIKYYKDYQIDGKDLDAFQTLGASFTDYMFYCPMRLQETMTSGQALRYQIQAQDACTAPSKAPYDCESRSKICITLSCHANEVPVVFGTWAEPGSCCKDVTQSENYTKTIQGDWIRFFNGELPWSPEDVKIYKSDGTTDVNKQQSHSLFDNRDGVELCAYFEDKYPVYKHSLFSTEL